jgi:LysM repeat protein
MLRRSLHRPALLTAAARLSILAAGCVSEEPDYQTAGVAPYGAERLYQNERVDDQRPSWGAIADGSLLAQEMTDANVMAVAFRGVDGARLAHELYGEVEAEKRDGNCGPLAKIENGETAYDIADYCDVPVETLLAANPGVVDPRAVFTGQTLNVPTGYAGLANTAWASIAYSLYVVQPGDSINKIAYSHRVAPTTLIAFNPGVDWTYLQAGAELRVPAMSAGSPVATAAPSAPPAYAPPVQPSGSVDYSISPEVESLMPYKLTPAQQAAESRVKAPPLLTVDRRTVDPGDEVMVSAVGLPPYSEVSIYRGANGRQMELVGTVQTDGEGRFSEPVEVKRKSDPGGVIFKATVEGSTQAYQSPRVGVNKIGDDSETDDEELGDEY